MILKNTLFYTSISMIHIYRIIFIKIVFSQKYENLKIELSSYDRKYFIIKKRNL